MTHTGASPPPRSLWIAEFPAGEQTDGNSQQNLSRPPHPRDVLLPTCSEVLEGVLPTVAGGVEAAAAALGATDVIEELWPPTGEQHDLL